MNEIFTQNLIIREFNIDDTNAYYKNNQDGQIKKYMPNHSHDDENEARKELEENIANYAETEMPVHFAIVKADINALIGHIGIGDSEIIENAYELCCGISRDYRGHNYAAEALRAFAPWCKSAFNIDKIYASVNSENIAPRKALLNAGFSLCGEKYENKKEDINLYIFI